MPDATFTDRTRRVLERARTEAAARGEASVGTEHLLFALAQDPSDRLTLLLSRLEVDVPRLREAVARRLAAPSQSRPLPPDIPYSRDAQALLERAAGSARDLGDHHLGPEHLFLGALSSASGAIVEVLAELRLGPTRARQAAEAINFGARGAE
jgi:ATP-dependent Clp protease ATP-binding subunit ClpA